MVNNSGTGSGRLNGEFIEGENKMDSQNTTNEKSAREKALFSNEIDKPEELQHNYTTGLLEKAIGYAKRGWRVFPCKPQGKTPLVKWRDQATIDPEVIRDFWKKYPGANIGVVTGAISGIVVVDVDGNEGMAIWDELVAAHGFFTETPTAMTGGGGEHYYFAHPGGTFRNTTSKIGEHIDTRGDGGYVVAPPSLHPSGGRYRWMGESERLTPIAMPDWLIERINAHGPADQLDDRGNGSGNHSNHGSKWLHESLDRSSVGNRNETGLWLACQLRDDGLTFEQAKQIMLEYAAKVPQNGGEPYTPQEALFSARSAFSRNPRQHAKGRAISFSKAQNVPDITETWGDEEEIDLEDLLPYSVDVPPLPEEMQLPEKLKANLDGTGRWLNDYVDFASKASPMSPPIFHEILGLSLLSTTIARRVYIRVANRNFYPNLYAFIVANSTLFAKTTAFEVAKRTLDLAELSRLTLPVGITPQSFIGELTSRVPDTFSNWDEEDKQDWKRERPFAAQRAWLMDEASSLLDAFDQKITADLLSLVLRLHDCPEKLQAASTIMRGRQTIRQAYLTICGPTTPAALKPHLRNPKHWGNGLFARFIFVTPNVPPILTFYPPELEIPQEIIDPLRKLSEELLPEPKETISEGRSSRSLRVELADGVWQLWERYHAGLWTLAKEKLIPEKLHSNYGRFHNLAIKIAMQLATIDSNDPQGEGITISLKHMAKAQMITEGYRASLHRLMDEIEKPSEEEDLERKIFKQLKISAGGNTERELARIFHKHAGERDELQKTLARMVQDGLIFVNKRKRKRGPAATIYQILPILK
jgi:hypothetical protein